MQLLTAKQAEFNAAMDRYEQRPAFRWSGKVVSFINVGLQVGLALCLLRSNIGAVAQLSALLCAYILADFVNGWVHLYMDNSDDYASALGPYFAAFHLHHRTPRYRRRPLALVYYEEAGAKLWLAVVECLALAGVATGLLGAIAGYFLLYFSCFSCVAEVSHYLCHSPEKRPIARWLGRHHLLLSSRYHARHHRDDNVQYAFLNGMTDPVLNWIAKRYYSGYKLTTDEHYLHYVGRDTTNRTAADNSPAQNSHEAPPLNCNKSS